MAFHNDIESVVAFPSMRGNLAPLTSQVLIASAPRIAIFVKDHKFCVAKRSFCKIDYFWVCKHREMAAVLLLHHYTTIGYEKYATLLFPTTVFWAFQSDGHYLHAQQFPI